MTLDETKMLSNCLFSFLWSGLTKSGSVPGSKFGKNSTTDTLDPNVAYTCPISNPMTPPPMTSNLSGTSSKSNAVRDVRTDGCPEGMPGIIVEVDPAAITLSLVLMSIPIMVSIPLVLWGLCLKLSLVPCSGWGGLFDTRIIVPAITMGIPGIAGLARLMRASTLDVLGQDFVRTAHAKGLSPLLIDQRHILKNALIPIITILSFSLAGMLTTGFITERLLGIPGVGDFAIQAIFNRDYPVIMAFTLILSTAFVVANLIADIAYTMVDPRIRLE